MDRRLTIGKNPDNDVIIDNPVISRYHAEMFVNDSGAVTQYALVDHSTNGTYVNGQFLHNASCYVARGDVILFSGIVQFDWNVLDDSFSGLGTTRLYNPQDVYHQGTYPSFDRRVSFVDALKSFFSKYADFTGRASRSEFWFMYLWKFIFGCALDVIGAVALAVSGLSLLTLDLVELLAGSLVWYIALLCVYGLAMFLPSLALMVRRIHDTGHSGVWMLMLLVPVANIVFFFIWTLTPSCPNANKWGI